MEEDRPDDKFVIEKIEMAGEVIKEPILSKSTREISGENIHRKVTFSPYFCECGRPINKENAVRCSHCQRLIEKSCSFEYQNSIHCRSCLKEFHGIELSKKEYFILLCIESGISKPKDISKTTGIDVDEVKKTLEKFLGNYLTNKPHSFFSKELRLTQLGIEALTVYSKVYKKDEDHSIVETRISDFLASKRKYALRLE